MRRAILIPVFIIVAVGLAVLWAGTMWLRSQAEQTEFTSERDILQIVIGNDVLEIPANYTRRASQREGETADRLDLIMLWPQGNGYEEANAKLFTDTSAHNRRILVTLSKREMAQDMTERLNSVYLELFEGEAREAGAGLLFQSLRAGSGYDGEVLVVSQNRDWVARCEAGQKRTPKTCIRDIHLGQSLSVRYRFSRALLGEWRRVDDLVTARVRDFLIE